MWADAQAFRGKSLVNNYRNKGLGKQIGYFTKKIGNWGQCTNIKGNVGYYKNIYISRGEAKTYRKIVTSAQIYKSKVKVGILHPIQQPGSYWDRS